ncbi:MAG TPA: cupredoxin domain-containing protein [Acidobacteriaceae bacterium]|nr:cupredoxin domain-containing protein [Acidobacteriaceae bacterium]
MKLISRRVIVIVAAACMGWPVMAQQAPPAAALPSTAQPDPTIMIHAEKYKFLPAEITLKQDQTVKLELTSDDIEHSLEVPGLGINGIMKKGEVTDVIVTPTKTGDYKGKCGKFCGFGHGKMHFLVHVVQ